MFSDWGKWLKEKSLKTVSLITLIGASQKCFENHLIYFLNRMILCDEYEAINFSLYSIKIWNDHLI